MFAVFSMVPGSFSPLFFLFLFWYIHTFNIPYPPIPPGSRFTRQEDSGSHIHSICLLQFRSIPVLTTS